MQQLEARLRVKLLHRTTRQVKVTAEGAGYYERVVRLLADLSDADASIAGASASPSGRLRVDVPSPLALRVLVPALPDFHARYPEIQLDLGVSDRMVDVIGGNVDCVLRGGELPDSSLQARRVGELGMGVHAAPAYLRRLGTPSHPRELEDTAHRIVGFLRASSGKVAPLALQRGRERIEVKARYAVALDDGNACLAAGLAGLGIVCLPHYMTEASVLRGELEPLFEGWQIEPMPLYLVFPPNRHISTRLRVFIAWVEELIAQEGLSRAGDPPPPATAPPRRSEQPPPASTLPPAPR